MTPAKLPPPIYVRTEKALYRMVEELSAARLFALDTESNSLYAYHHHVCLIQISTTEQDYIVDTVILDDMSSLRELVAATGIEVTMHAAENDILLLHHDYDFVFEQVFDTLWGARILGWSRPGLASILDEHFGIKLDKRLQRSDWGKRPLTPEHLQYARMDTNYLLALRDMQSQALKANGHWEEAREVFESLKTIRWQEGDPPTMWRLSGIRSLEPEELAVLSALFDWREAAASRRDVPPFKILRNEVLIALAQEQPRDLQDLRRMKGIPRRLPNRVAWHLIDTIAEGRTRPAPAPPRNRNGGRRPDEGELERYERLRGWRTRQASARGVDPDVILTNHILMTIAKAAPSDTTQLDHLGLMGPWKLANYGEDIVEAVR